MSSPRSLNRIATVSIALLFASGLSMHAQDTRNVSEPAFPSSCTTLPAQLSISGGEPSSETEFDTARIQAALNSCGAGKAVELTTSGTSNAFLIQPIKLPTGVTLLVDAGVTVFASRNPADYQRRGREACGTVGHGGDGCNPLFTSDRTTGSGLMGYGVIDGRGGDRLIVKGAVQNYSWYSNTLKAYVPRPVLDQNNFDMVTLTQASNFTFYKITLKNSPEFNIHWQGRNGSAVTKGLTIWGVKIITPHNIANTDGIDPTDNTADVTIADSFISNGDDNVALSSTARGNPVSNVSIKNLHTYAGFGVSIGSHTQGGINNVLVDTVDQSGNPADSGSSGLKIKSSTDRGGLVNNITFQHICQQNERSAIRISPYYIKSPSTAHIPSFSNITLRDITVLPGQNGGSGRFTFQGFDGSHRTTLMLENINVVGTPDVNSEKPQEAAITIDPATVKPAVLQHLTGTGVSYTHVTSNASVTPYPCSASNFQPLTGELLLSTDKATNLQSLADSDGSAFTLTAVVAPVSAEYPALLGSVVFYDGDTIVGTDTLGGNGTLARLVLSGVPAGTHTYTARYVEDGNYPVFAFGSVAVTVNAPPPPPSPFTIPPNAKSSGDLTSSSNWHWGYDPGTAGNAVGSSSYPEANPSLDGHARKFSMAYNNKAGERFSLTFDHNTAVTHFVYDTYVYILDPSQLVNLEMDMNQVMADGRTVIYAFQCSGNARAWEYTTVDAGRPHWHTTGLPCDTKTWTAKTWHHVQIASHRDANGNVTFDWVNLDEKFTQIQNATGNGAIALHWTVGALNLNFQLDGSMSGNGSVTAYADKLTIYYW